MSNDTKKQISDPLETQNARNKNEVPTPWLVESLKKLDEEAWDLVLSMFKQRLSQDIKASLYKRGLSADLLDDVEQETWFVAIRQIDHFMWTTTEQFYHWLRVIAHRVILNLQRKVKNNVSLDSFGDELDGNDLTLDLFLYAHGLIGDNVENQIVLDENMRILEKALRDLKPRDREIILRRLVDGETPTQMAPDYGVKPETISVMLVRAKNAILNHMKNARLGRDE